MPLSFSLSLFLFFNLLLLILIGKTNEFFISSISSNNNNSNIDKRVQNPFRSCMFYFCPVLSYPILSYPILYYLEMSIPYPYLLYFPSLSLYISYHSNVSPISYTYPTIFYPILFYVSFLFYRLH